MPVPLSGRDSVTSSERQIWSVPSTAIEVVPVSQPEVPPPPRAKVPAETVVVPVKPEEAERASTPAPALTTLPPPEIAPPKVDVPDCVIVSVLPVGMVMPTEPVSAEVVIPMSPPVLDSAPLSATAPPKMPMSPVVAIALATVMSAVLPVLPSVAKAKVAGRVNFWVLSELAKLAPSGSMVRPPEVRMFTVLMPMSTELPRRVMSPDWVAAPIVTVLLSWT